MAIATLYGWPYMPENQNRTGNGEASAASSHTKAVQPTHVIIDSPISGTIETHQKTNDGKSQPEQPIPWWREALKPEWVTVVVTAAYTVLALLQWLAIRRQANLLERQITEAADSSKVSANTATNTLSAMQRQVDLMEAPYSQWLVLKLTSVEAHETEQWRKLNVSMRLVNPTSYPVKLKEGTVSFDFSPHPYSHRLEVGDDTFLPPDSPLYVDVALDLNTSQYAHYAGGGRLRIRILVDFLYEGVLKRVTSQRGDGWLECGSNLTPSIEWMAHMNPEPRQDDGQNPN